MDALPAPEHLDLQRRPGCLPAKIPASLSENQMSLLDYVPPNPNENYLWYPINGNQLTGLHSRAQFLMYGGASGGGKRLSIDTELPTPNGWTTMRDVQPGDALFDDKGLPCRVIWCSPVLFGDAYRITFDDGTSIVADAEHKWLTFTFRDRVCLVRRTAEARAKRRSRRPKRGTGKKPWLAELNAVRQYEYLPLPSGTVVTTAEIIQTIDDGKHKNHSIPVPLPLHGEIEALPIPPYTLGAWLGDGAHNDGRFTSVDEEVIEEIRKDGYFVQHHDCNPQSWGIHKIASQLRQLGLIRNKHIPPIYLRASSDQRLSLLQGLMDTDGECAADGKAEFTSTREALAEDVYELACSLGLKATIREGRARLYGRDCGPKWRVGWTDTLPVFRLPRKLKRLRSKLRGCQRWRYIVKVEKTLDVPMRCIAVDSASHLYLAGRAMVPTHNTDFLVADAAQERDNRNLRALILRKSFTEMGNIMDRTRDLYSQMGATWRGNPHQYWRFPSGAQVRLGYMAEDKHVGIYQGNPFTYLGVDESTHQPEKRIRRILPWLASTDPALFVRARFATNPGGVGADWHLGVFLRNNCPIHHPQDSVIPGAIYKGSAWPSDGKPVLKTVSFIPAFVADNPLYTQDKIDALKTQEAAIAEKLLTGCWCDLSGRYFSFLTPKFKKPLAEAGDQYWFNHIISIDYGYGGSKAAAGEYCIHEPSVEFPAGRMLKTGELVEENMGSKDFAKKVVSTFILPEISGHRREHTCIYFDPATDAHTGTGKSNMELMMEVFEEYGIPGIKAAKDRIGNAQNLYAMLKSTQLVICDSAPRTFKSLSTRIHDPDRPGDVLKVDGDPLDDLYDETSYGANTFFSPSAKPKEVKVAEKLREMKEAGVDEHSLYIHRTRMEMQMAKEDAPTRMGRSRRPIVLR